MIHKQTARLTLVLIALSMLPRVCRSDGLIYQLPAEGVWARYEEHIKGEGTLTSKVLEPKKVKHEFTRTLTVKSLERVQRHEQLCRWIEFVSEMESGDVPSQPKRVLKLLVPEEYLKRGKDPLSHAIKTFFNPKGVDRSSGRIRSNIDEGFNRVQYELDRIRVMFPKPLDNVKSELRETLELHGRKWVDCEILTGSRHYDGPLANDGRWVFDAKYRIALHPDAPFGFVSMVIFDDSIEYSRTVTASLKSNRKITLVEIGQSAKSQVRHMTDHAKTKEPDGLPMPNDDSGENAGDEQLKKSLPQILELERIFQAKDGDAFREFILLGSLAGQKGLDDLVRQVDAGEFSDIDVLGARVDGPLVRVSGKVAIAGQPQLIPFVFVKRGENWRWLMVNGGELLKDAKAVLSDAEWNALNGKTGDAKVN